MPSRSYPVTEPHLDDEDRKHLLAAFDSGWISSQGAYLGEFERAFAKFCGTRFALATSSGTTALHLTLMALGASGTLVLHTLFDPEGWTKRGRLHDDLNHIESSNLLTHEKIIQIRQHVEAIRQRPEMQEWLVRSDLGHVMPNDLVFEVAGPANP